jgi:hypothetical protein
LPVLVRADHVFLRLGTVSLLILEIVLIGFGQGVHLWSGDAEPEVLGPFGLIVGPLFDRLHIVELAHVHELGVCEPVV